MYRRSTSLRRVTGIWDGYTSLYIGKIKTFSEYFDVRGPVFLLELSNSTDRQFVQFSKNGTPISEILHSIKNDSYSGHYYNIQDGILKNFLASHPKNEYDSAGRIVKEFDTWPGLSEDEINEYCYDNKNRIVEIKTQKILHPNLKEHTILK